MTGRLVMYCHFHPLRAMIYAKTLYGCVRRTCVTEGYTTPWIRREEMLALLVLWCGRYYNHRPPSQEQLTPAA